MTMTEAQLVLPAPAKLNLMLHILGRRPDGYHELQTLFQFLDYGDELGFALREDGVICLQTDVPGVPHDSNLIVKAARALQKQSGCTLGMDIWLENACPWAAVSAVAARMQQPHCSASIICGNWAGMKIASHNWASHWVPMCRFLSVDTPLLLRVSGKF